MTSTQRTISWVLSLVITVVVCGYGICLLERGAHRLLAKPCPPMAAGAMHPGAPGSPMPDSGMHPGMGHPMGDCPDSMMMKGGMGPCGMHHDGMCCGDGMRGCDMHGGMGSCGMPCGPRMGCMPYRFGPPPMLGFAFTAGLGAFVLLIGAAFGAVTLRRGWGEKTERT